MKCELPKPESCFNCPYDDCIDYSVPSKAESAILNEFATDRKNHRKEYFAQYYKDNIEKRKEYSFEYYRKHKAEEMPDLSAWKIWGCGFYVNLHTREKVTECPT